MLHSSDTLEGFAGMCSSVLAVVQRQYFERSIYSVVLMTQWVLGGANVVFVGLMPRVNQDPRGFKGTNRTG